MEVNWFQILLIDVKFYSQLKPFIDYNVIKLITWSRQLNPTINSLAASSYYFNFVSLIFMGRQSAFE